MEAETGLLEQKGLGRAVKEMKETERMGKMTGDRKESEIEGRKDKKEKERGGEEEEEEERGRKGEEKRLKGRKRWKWGGEDRMER